jgi:hypothetical protein
MNSWIQSTASVNLCIERILYCSCGKNLQNRIEPLHSNSAYRRGLLLQQIYAPIRGLCANFVAPAEMNLWLDSFQLGLTGCATSDSILLRRRVHGRSSSTSCQYTFIVNPPPQMLRPTSHYSHGIVSVDCRSPHLSFEARAVYLGNSFDDRIFQKYLADVRSLHRIFGRCIIVIAPHLYSSMLSLCLNFRPARSAVLKQNWFPYSSNSICAPSSTVISLSSALPPI